MKPLFAALSFLSILPVPQGWTGDRNSLSAGVVFFPAAGLIMAAVSAGRIWLISLFLPQTAAARDTDGPNKSQITRAGVESVARSTVNGITAPLFYVLVTGPAGAMIYKAVNTLDSTSGCKNERYIRFRFGWALASLDDAANYLPARLTSPVMCLAACILNLKPANAFKAMIDNRKNHTSPNAGFTESAMAGALGIQLGGANCYFGKISEKLLTEHKIEDLNFKHIKRANQLIYVTSILFLIFGLVFRFTIIKL